MRCLKYSSNTEARREHRISRHASYVCSDRIQYVTIFVLDPEDRDSTILRNVGKFHTTRRHIPEDRRLENYSSRIFERRHIFKNLSTLFSGLHDTSAGIVMAYGLHGRVRFMVGARYFLYSTAPRLSLRPTHPPVHWLRRYPSPGVKRPGLEADLSPSCSTEVKNDGTIPPLTHMSSWLINYFAFFFNYPFYHGYVQFPIDEIWYAPKILCHVCI
jgi:hypothetical protein